MGAASSRVPDAEPRASRCCACRGGSFSGGRAVRIAQEMIKNKLPSIYSYHEHVRAGGPMTYHQLLRRVPSTRIVHRQDPQGRKARGFAGAGADQIRAVVNLKTAKALGLEVPPTLLALADEVIE